MTILNLAEALQKDMVSCGSVLIQSPPQVRSGKKNDFMVGQVMTPEGSAEFKIWEERIFDTVRQHGPGIYDVETCGSDFNGIYLTVRKIMPTTDLTLRIDQFLPRIPQDQLTELWRKTTEGLKEQGVSDTCWQLIDAILKDPALGGRFFLEGAAMTHHDNKIGGLVHHTTKMLSYLCALLENTPALKKSADLLCMGIVLHDIGKVFEYKDLGLGEYWYANHRVRGLEFITTHREAILSAYSEEFYRQLQSIIIGHHGDYGDRPTTVAAAIVHYIDTLDSQVTGLVEAEQNTPQEKIRYGEWGWLYPIPIDY